MSTDTGNGASLSDVTVPRRRTVLRFWLPLAGFVFLFGVILAIWTLPPEDFPRFYRVLASEWLGALGLILLIVPWLGLSRVRLSVRLGVPLAAVGLAVASVGKVDFSGDMVPIVLFRWEATPDERLDAFRVTDTDVPAEQTVVREASPIDDPTDYPEYRNRARDGVARGPALARDWNAKPPRELWRRPCGRGYAGFAVAGGRAVTIEQRREDEVIACYDAASGRELWTYGYPAHFYDPRAEGPMATPTLTGGDVYSIGGTGKLVCLRLADGALKWEVDALADNDIPGHGVSGSPLVYDDVVVVTPGDQRKPTAGRAVAAYDRKDGHKVWNAGDATGGYSSPMLAKLAGERQLLSFDGAHIAGYDPSGAGELWALPWPALNGINAAQPLLLPDDRLFVTSGYANRCGVVRVRRVDGKWAPAEEWSSAAMRSRFCSPILHDGLIYGLNEGVLTCLDSADGRRLWRGGRYGQGQLVRCDDLLLILSETGELALVEAAGPKSRELGRYKALIGEKTWNCPSLAGGKVYVRNHREMACYHLRD